MNRIVLLAVLLCVVLYGYGQSGKRISGYVKDLTTGELLIGASIQAVGNSIQVRSNNYGYFAMHLPPNITHISVAYVGYDTQSVRVDSSTLRLNVLLVPSAHVLEEVVVSNRSANTVSSPQMGTIGFTMQEVKSIPVVFGEKDILKTIQLLPGIGKGAEGSSDFYVRGGGGDQNLVLLDEATVYNASHLLGFFSAFNSEAIKDLELYKGGVPPQYGGRLSSVLDIRMIDGNNRNFSVEGGLGLIASRLKVEGPLIKDKSSFMISGRRTYADLFLKLSRDETVNSSKLYFYDLNAKANYRFNDKNVFYLSGYFGKDDLGYDQLFSFDWGNATATARWNHIFSDRLFSNTSLIYSDFTYHVNVSSDESVFQIASKIENFNLKEDLTFYANNNNTIRFGFSVLRQHISPASLRPGIDAAVNPIEIDRRKGTEAALYISHEWKPLSWLSTIYGVRATDFMVGGPGTFYQFDRDGDVRGVNYFTKKVIKHYFNIEPRFSLSIMLSPQQSVKASYNRITQNLHQLTNTTSSLPTDQYVLSSLQIKPQVANQVALGYFRNLRDNTYEMAVETFYKTMDNQIDYRNGADLQANQYLEGDLLFGQGRSYGLELYLRKMKGRFNGWLSYTLGKSERQFEQINEGRWFNARQDRTHDISVVGQYELSKSWTLGATFTFYTGNAITFPSGKYQVDRKTMFYYTERNGYRMPDYHRLDLSATYEPRSINKKLHSSWSFGLYNAYHRKNAYFIDFRENKKNPNATEAYKVALFGIIPSVTWNFKF